MIQEKDVQKKAVVVKGVPNVEIVYCPKCGARLATHEKGHYCPNCQPMAWVSDR